MEEEIKQGTTPGEPPEGETPKAEVIEPLPVKTYTEEEYKGLQRRINLLNQEVQQSKLTTSEIQSVKAEIAELRELVALAWSPRKEEGFTAEPESVNELTRKMQELEFKRQTRIQTEQQQQALQQAAWNEIAEITSDAGITSTDESLGKAKEFWVAGKIQDAVKETRKIAMGILKEQAKVTRQTAEVEEAEKEKLHKYAKVETGGPTAGRVSFEDAKAAYARGDIDRKEYEEAARRAGKTL